MATTKKNDAVRHCPKCGSRRLTIIGESRQPPLVHRRCQDCGHLFSLSPNAAGDE